MKRFVAVLMLAGGLLVAGGANATSVTWTIPTTALTGSATYTSVSGTFAWDAVNQVVSNVNVTLVVGGTPTLITSSSVNAGGIFIVLNNTPPSTGQPVFVIDYTSLTNTATPTVVSYIAGGPCSVTGGQCVTFSGGYSSANNVTLTPPYTPPAPASIPSLSEWTQLLLGLMVMTMIGWQWRKQQN